MPTCKRRVQLSLEALIPLQVETDRIRSGEVISIIRDKNRT